MQPVTITCTKHTRKHLRDIAQMISLHVERIMLYNVASRLAFGEWNVRLKYSNIINYIKFDIAGGGTSSESVFNFDSFDKRLDSFNQNNLRTLHRIEHNGSPARIEVAFRSPAPSLNRDTLINGIFDVINTCLVYTRTYRVKPILKLTRFCFMGVVAKMKLLKRAMAQLPDACDIYDELLKIRPEVGAIFKSWYSGRGRLNNPHIPSPKNAAMACRIILAPMSATPHTEKIRLGTMKTATFDYYSHFTDHLFDINGNDHVRVENPMFVSATDDLFVQRYTCGKACDRCWKVFASADAIHGFSTHSCVDVCKGSIIDVTHKSFIRFHDSLLKRLNFGQRLLQQVLDGNNNNIFLTGFAGTGKSYALLCAIQEVLIRKGMYTFAVISPTKVAAGLVNGITFHSFFRLGFAMDSNLDVDCAQTYEDTRTVAEVILKAQTHARTMMTLDKDRFLFFRYGLQYLFVDEAGMMSHDQFLFMDTFLRMIRGKDNPFGGVRIILCGDVLQLPPLVRQLSKYHRHPVYFFESESFMSRESAFVVIYLKENHRQNGENSDFARVLNNLRDGELDEADLTKINSGYGKNVKYDTVLRVFKALIRSFEQEIEKKRNDDLSLRQPHALAQFQERVYNNGRLWHSPYDQLIYRMEKYWGKDRLAEHLKQVYPPLYEKKSSRVSPSDVENSAFYQKMLTHFERLKPTLNDCDTNTSNVFDDGNSFVISMENCEISAIVSEYNKYRSGMVSQYTCRSKDTVDEGSTRWSDDMSVFAQSQSKLETLFEPSLNLRVFYTDNGIDKNIANNGLGTIVGFGLNGNEVDYITVIQCNSNPDIISHPINVYRKTRSLIYTIPGSFPVEYVKITRSQFPLKAADSGTPYTAQGVTLIQGYIVNNQRSSTNGYGRIYVAFSRAVSSDLVFPLHPLTSHDISADPVALRFDKFHRDRVLAKGGVSHVI
jgi:hypothetical protein